MMKSHPGHPCSVALSERPSSCLVLLFLALTGMPELCAEPGTARLPDVVITSTPLPVESRELGRSVEVVSSTELRESRAASAAEMLEEMTAVSVSERGANAVQADLSIRGSTFQQVLVTLDGLQASDAQTAHHNLDLPFPVRALERITVIPGPGSAFFGPTAFAGTVDLTPRIPRETAFEIFSAFGGFNTRRIETTTDVVQGREAFTLSTSFARSDGFQDGTDYDVFSLWASSYTEIEAGESAGVRLSVGHADKDFGAQDFYATFPSRERTSTVLVDLAPQVQFDSGWHLKAIGRFRRHDDEFILIENNPSFYRNVHRTDSLAGRITLVSPEWYGGTSALGLERSDFELESSNLGDRDASLTSGFVQHRLAVQEWTADVGLRIDHHDQWGTEVSPSLAFSWAASDTLRLRAAGGRGVRAPSFTELYYTDPANTGSPDLKPEKAWGTEAGLDLTVQEDTTLSATCFRREARGLIDWVRAQPSDPWLAQNIGRTTTQGIELSLLNSCRWLRTRASYRYIGLDAESCGLESKYARNVPRHDTSLKLSLPETRGFSASVGLRYRDVPTLDRYWLLSARIAQRCGAVTFFARGQNLLDERYEEIPGVPTAGAFAEAGLEVRW